MSLLDTRVQARPSANREVSPGLNIGSPLSSYMFFDLIQW